MTERMLEQRTRGWWIKKSDIRGWALLIIVEERLKKWNPTKQCFEEVKDETKP